MGENKTFNVHRGVSPATRIILKAPYFVVMPSTNGRNVEEISITISQDIPFGYGFKSPKVLLKLENKVKFRSKLFFKFEKEGGGV